MDKVFVSGNRNAKPSGKKFRFRNFGVSKSGRRDDTDARTEYFPYSGGDGVDEHEYLEEHLNYEPADIMPDVDFPIEQPNGLGQQIRRVLVRGSKYDVYQSLPSSPLSSTGSSGVATPRSTNSHSSPNLVAMGSHAPEIPPELMPLHPASSSPSGETNLLHDFLTFEWANSIPVTLDDGVSVVRKLSRASVVLLPFDNYIDGFEEQIPGSQLFFVGVELFVLMLVGHAIAKVTQVVCSPAVLITKLIWRLCN